MDCSYWTPIANAFVRESEREQAKREADIEWMMTVVNDVLGNNDVCRGCTDDEERTCDECRRIVADRIMHMLAMQLE